MHDSTKTIAGPHFVRFGTAADQKFLLGEFLNTYDQLVLNANMVAHMPAALASIVIQKAKNKPYIIDPQTHAFQHDVSLLLSKSASSEGKIKRSISKLIDAYGELVENAIIRDERPLEPSDLLDHKQRYEFCERVLRFQTDSLAKEAKEADTQKYYNYLAKKEKIVAPSFQPSMLVAPYFFMSSSGFSPWLKTNIACLKDSLKISSKKKFSMAAQIVVSKGVLSDPTSIKALVEEYSSIDGLDAFLIWVDNFPEHSATLSELQHLIDLINQLGKHAPVVNLYGGYFSVLIHKLGLANGLAAVTHSLEYGEDRPVVPVGGGVPVAKFYLPSLHFRVHFRDAIRAARALGGFESKASFHSEVCDCKQCKLVIDDDPESSFDAYGRTKSISYMQRGRKMTRQYPLTPTKLNTVSHYMRRKYREYGSQQSSSEVVSELRQAFKKLESHLSPEATGHCETWAQAIETPRPK